MAIYDNLPVFKAAYDLLIEVYEMCDKFSREYRYTIAERLKNDITQLMICIYRATGDGEGRKQDNIRQARELLVTTKLYIRLLHDLRQLNVKRYAMLSDKAEVIAKQLTAWSRSAEANAARAKRSDTPAGAKTPAKNASRRGRPPKAKPKSVFDMPPEQFEGVVAEVVVV